MHYLFYCKNGSLESSGLPDSRPYPDVNTTLFKESALKALSLMNDANLVMEKITTSQTFSTDLMRAAQQSNKTEVQRLIQSTGIKKKPIITYNPDGITMNFQDYIEEKECCHIILKLRWV